MGEAEEEEVLVEKEKEEDREREAMKGGEAFSNHTLPFSTPLISAPSSLLRHWSLCRPTVVWNKQEYRRKYGPLARPFAHSLVCLRRTACFACALRSFARSLTSLTPSLVGK